MKVFEFEDVQRWLFCMTHPDDEISSTLFGGGNMKEPGLDDRHRDEGRPKSGEIQQKRSDTLNRNLSRRIPQFRSDATLDTKDAGELPFRF